MTDHCRYINHIVGLWGAGYHPALQPGAIDAARKHVNALASLAASKTEQCSDLRTELDALRAATNPELLASERAANAVLTSEVERLTRALRVAVLALAHAMQEHGAIYRPAYEAVNAALSGESND